MQVLFLLVIPLVIPFCHQEVQRTPSWKGFAICHPTHAVFFEESVDRAFRFTASGLPCPARPLLNPTLGLLLHLSQFARRLRCEFRHACDGFDCVVAFAWDIVEIASRVESKVRGRKVASVEP